MRRDSETRDEQPHSSTDSQSESEKDGTTDDAQSSQERLIDAISPDAFTAWYREREVAENIRNGQHYFNGASAIQPAEKHSPSRFLQCHRKAYYTAFNAPKETQPPRGIFWFGTRFEEDIIVPFLEAVAGNEEYITNSMWVDFTEETAAGELRIKGETDPVVVTRDNDPVLLTEIKTKQSLEHVTGPSDRHRTQAHAYMRGLTLSEYHDSEVNSAVIIYGSRTDLDIRAYRVDFDQEFWEDRVLEWAATQTQYQIRNELPPASPETDWECKYCSYRERCGNGDRLFEDEGITGLLPGFTDYPREHLEDYLEAHRNAKLTPTLAHQHPDLADEYGVYDWNCSTCGATKQWDEPNWTPAMDTLPRCQHCSQNGDVALLSSPTPAEQPVKRGQTDE